MPVRMQQGQLCPGLTAQPERAGRGTSMAPQQSSPASCMQVPHNRARALAWSSAAQLLALAGDGPALGSASLTVSLWRFAGRPGAPGVQLQLLCTLGKAPWPAWPSLRTPAPLSCAFSPSGAQLLLASPGQAPLLCAIQVRLDADCLLGAGGRAAQHNRCSSPHCSKISSA